MHLFGLGRGIPEAVDKYFQLLNAIVLRLVSGLELLLARRLTGQILVVVPRIKVHSFVPYFDDALDRDIEKIAVVRNQDKSIRIRSEVFLKPVACLEIEVVGRLIKQQQIRFL